MANIINRWSIKHPNTFLIQSGSTQYIKDIYSINQSIRLLLTTAKNELLGDPNFGCRLYEFIHDYEGDALKDLLVTEIVTELNKQEPRIFLQEDDVSVTYSDIDHLVIIDIAYNLRYTNYRESYRYIVKKEEDIVYGI